MRLQSLMGAAANDLKTGDAGTDAEGVVRKKRAAPAGGAKAPAGKKGSATKVTNEEGDEWDEDEEFEAVILSRKISEGMKQDGFRKGTDDRDLPHQLARLLGGHGIVGAAFECRVGADRGVGGVAGGGGGAGCRGGA